MDDFDAKRIVQTLGADEALQLANALILAAGRAVGAATSLSAEAECDLGRSGRAAMNAVDSHRRVVASVGSPLEGVAENLL